jgi:amino acid adenylation domain-containing protein
MSEPRNVSDIYPLSPAQRGLLMVVLLSADQARFYSDQLVLSLRGRLDEGAWREAWRLAVERHPVLRTQFVWERRAQPLQVVRREVELPWQHLDWRGLPAEERERQLDVWLRQDHDRGFALDQAPLCRFAFIDWEDGGARFVWSFHHLILDGWSLVRVLAEVRAHYGALLAGRQAELAPPRPFRDYIAWLERQDGARGEAFWRREMAGLGEETPLPFDRRGEGGVAAAGEMGAAEGAEGAAEAPEVGAARENGADGDMGADGDTGVERAVLPAATVRGMARLTRRHGLTPNTVFQGAWALLLARTSGRGEVVFGSVVSGRPAELPGVEEMVGLFINALPVRVRFDPALPLLPWLAELQERQMEQRRFEHSALEDIARWAGVPHERQLFGSLVVFQNFPADPLGPPDAADFTLEIAAGREATHYPLALYVKVRDEGIALGLAFHRDRFTAAAARRLLGLLANLVEGIAGIAGIAAVAGPAASATPAVNIARPAARLGEIPLLGDGERREILAAGSGPGDSCGQHRAAGGAPCVLDAIERQAAATPHALAVQGVESRLTYAELDDRADRLAAHLRWLGVGPEEVVGLCLERSPDLVVGLLGIWKAGGAYLPLDPVYPPERLSFMVADAGARIVLTTSALAGRLPGAALRVRLDEAIAAGGGSDESGGIGESGGSDESGGIGGSGGSGENDEIAPMASGVSGASTAGDVCAAHGRRGRRAPGRLAYVIYTSGSSGTPKGVMVEHGALAVFVAGAAAALGVGPGDRVLQFASISFDTSAEEIFPCLTRGAALVLRDAAMAGSFAAFLGQVERAGITLLDLPTAYWHELVADLARRELPLPACVRLVVIGGEEARASTLAAWRARVGTRVRLLNTYGPTEATVVATLQDLTLPAGGPGTPGAAAAARVPIGRAVAGARTYVLGRDLDLLPAGLDGELWIGGAALARGYLGRPDLTADRFRPNPFAPAAPAAPGAPADTGAAGERIYRTGDLVRLLPGGELAFRGRIDRQVKLRGFRIELGEVEAALRRLSGVREAAVVLAGGGASRRLVAFAVAEPPAPAARELRALLAKALPEHMVPAEIVFLEALPLTPSGKLDRGAAALQALALAPAAPAAPADGAADRRGERARTPVEELVAGIWSDLLQVESVGLDEDFFALGGHSLLVAQVLSRLRQTLRVEVPLVEFFRRPTVAALAATVEQADLGALAAELPELGPPRPAPRDGRRLPLSYAQERVWFLEQLQPGNLAYNFQVTFRFAGRLGVAALAGALGEIVRRHEVLRTSFPTVEGRPCQVIHPPAPFRLPVIDLGGLAGEVRAAHAGRLTEELIRTPFELARGPLIRWRLLRLAAEDHQLVQVEHHFVHDGWSLAILLREMQTLYGAFLRGEPSPLPEPPVQYADFALWQREWMEGAVMQRLLAFWKGKLAGSPPPLELATDRPRPPQGSTRGDFVLPPVEPGLYEALRRFGRREGFTLYMTMLAGFLALLQRYTGQDDLVIGTSNANRRVREIEGMLGMVVNTLALRADLSGRPSWRAQLARVREMALEIYAHQDMPFERLVQELRVERQPGRNPLFQILFNFHDAAIPDVRLDGLETAVRVRSNRTAKMDMNVIVVPRAEQRVGRTADEQDRRANLHWEYNTDLFDTVTVLRMAAHYQVLLAGALAAPELPLPELPLFSAAERGALLREWNDTSAPYARGSSVPALFAAWVARTPGAVAVVCGAESLTYAEVEARANRLAHHLRSRGAGCGERVALAVERSLDLLPAILGILKSGAAYVPLDPSHPPERVAWMLADCGARLLVTQDHLLPRLPPTEAAIVALPRDRAAIGRLPATVPRPAPAATDPAYVMYTSGSTGRPKGVVVTHRNIVRLVAGGASGGGVADGAGGAHGVGVADRAGVAGGGGYVRRGPLETYLHLAPITFDASTFELWGALLHGSRLVLLPPGGPSLQVLGEVIARHGVTTVWMTTALFHQVVEEDLAVLAPVRQLLTGGEVISPAPVRQALAALPGLTLTACYGPTEGTTFTTCHQMTSGRDVGSTVAIGRPIGNTRVFVVDRELRPLPVGAPGELLIGGDGVALGYLNRPDLTAERFVPDPFGDAGGAGSAGGAGDGGGEAGGRLYRTGDRVRWLAGGVLDFIGRLDDQVKIRGFRIEPAEIETVLAAHPLVGEAAVLAQPAPGGRGELRLVAYVSPRRRHADADLASSAGADAASLTGADAARFGEADADEEGPAVAAGASPAAARAAGFAEAARLAGAEAEKFAEAESLAELESLAEAESLAELESLAEAERFAEAERLAEADAASAAGAGSDGDLAAALRRHLAAKLPAYMVPAAWVFLAAMPRTATDKIDRRALARLGLAGGAPGGGGANAGAPAPPQTPAQEAVAAIWRQVLGIAEVNLGDDFFLLGGHSLAAIRVLSRLRQELGVELPLGDLFEHTILADLAAAVAAGPAAGDDRRIPAAPSFAAEELSDGEIDALLGEMAGEAGA